MERKILGGLDEQIRLPRAAAFLADLARQVTATLHTTSDARLAWRTVPLEIYGKLPVGIASSWIFVLRAGCTSGAERHPNSVQRVMSLCGLADMQTWDGERWVSNLLQSDADRLKDRWLSIPANVWHRPVMGEVDWVVVSFHTAADEELIEELPLDDEHPDRGSRAAEVYAGRVAR